MNPDFLKTGSSEVNGNDSENLQKIGYVIPLCTNHAYDFLKLREGIV